MKKFIPFLSLILIGLFIGNDLFAQRKINVVSVSRDRDIYNFYTLMHEAFPISFSEPSSPRFIFYDTQKSFIFGMGGYLQATGVYDFNGLPSYTYFYTSDISPKGQQLSPSWNMSPNQATLFFKLIGNTRVGRLVSYLSMQFVGPDMTPKIQQAFVQFRGFTVGRTYSTFSDIVALPVTIDLEGPSSAALIKQSQIRYTYPFAKEWNASLAVEYSQPAYTIGTNTVENVRPKAPDITGNVKYQFNKNSHIQASGLARFLFYENTLNGNDEYVVGWGAALSGKIKTCDFLNVYFQGVYGKGSATYIQDIQPLGYSLVPSKNKSRLVALTNYGFYGGLQMLWNRNLQSNLVYSYVRVFNSTQLEGTDYSNAQYAAGNIIWNFSEFGQVGIEYDFGYRDNYNQTYGYANRINAMLRYSF